jgi:hypothetical protein
MSLVSMDGAPRWFHTVFSIVGNIDVGSLSFILPDGREFRAEGARPGPNGVIVVKNPELFWRMIRDGELGFAEAYMDGWWDTPDLQAVLDAALLNNDTVARGFGGKTFTPSGRAHPPPDEPQHAARFGAQHLAPLRSRERFLREMARREHDVLLGAVSPLG